MKLQIAFDLLDLQKCLDIAKSVEEYADSFEIRSSLIFKYGVHAIEEFRAHFPNKEIFVQTQIVDNGQSIIPMCINAGANWISVMAGTNKEVIHAAATLASQKNNFVILDLLDTHLIGQAAMDAKKLGIDAILYHNISDDDSQDENSSNVEEWNDLRGNSNLPIYIDNNINRKNINFIISLQPNTVVIGKSITLAENPVEEAQYYYTLLQNS